MRFAYADPPYLGCGKLYVKHHPDAKIWDDPSTHQKLIESLSEDFPDGWAYSLTSTTLHTLLPFCPPDVRVMAWVKPFAMYRNGTNPSYSWEPIIVRGGRPLPNFPKVRDFIDCPIALKKGLTGAKPDGFWFWLFGVLGIQNGDELVDLFPGTNRCETLLRRHLRQTQLFSNDNTSEQMMLDGGGS